MLFFYGGKVEDHEASNVILDFIGLFGVAVVGLLLRLQSVGHDLFLIGASRIKMDRYIHSIAKVTIIG
jgi:hypothetical protein